MRLLLLVLLAGCTRSNERIVADLERAAVAQHDPDANALLDADTRIVRPRGKARPVTLDMLDRTLPTVRGRVNGVSMPLILDSGVSLVALSGPAAESTRLYVPARPETRAISPGFDARYRLGVFDELSLGAARFGRGAATVPLHEAKGGVYGIVGCSVLGAYRVTFDFLRRRILLEPGASHGEPFFVPVRIGDRTYRLLVDSGAARVFLEPWAARELGLISAVDAARHADKSDAFRTGRVTRIRLASIEVAGRRFEDVSGGVVNTFDENKRRAGLLGLAALGKLAWTLDFSAQTIRVRD